MAVSTITVTGAYKNPDNTNSVGTVRFTETGRSSPSASSTVVPPVPVVASLTAGALSQVLVLLSGAYSYQVVEEIVGARPITFSIPGTASVDLSTIVVGI